MGAGERREQFLASYPLVASSSRLPSPLPPLALSSTWWIAFSVLASIRVWAFFTGAFDLGVHVHALRTVRMLGPGAAVPLIDRSFLADHFSPLELPLALIVGTHWDPYVLVVLQAAAVALAGFFVWRIAVRHRATTPLLHQAAFLSAPLVLFAAWNDFHPSVLAAPFLVVFFDRIRGGNEQALLVAGCAAALLREDVALVVLLGLLIFPRLSWQRLLVALVAGIGVAASLRLGGRGWFSEATAYLRSGDLLPSLLDEVWDGGALLWIWPGALIPWVFVARPAARYLMVAVVFSLPLLVIDLPVLQDLRHHYYFPMAAPLAVGAVHGRPWPVATPRVGVAALAVALFLGPLGAAAAGDRVAPAWVVVGASIRNGAEIAAVHEWIDQVDPGESVSAATFTVPFLRADEVRMWPSPFRDLVLRVSPQPIVQADPSAEVTDVVAPTRSDIGAGPTAAAVGLAAQFDLVSISPDGRFQHWRRNR